MLECELTAEKREFLALYERAAPEIKAAVLAILDMRECVQVGHKKGETNQCLTR